ncbi:sulfatase [Candidatus Falkowbacteria bacterium]|jgi:arylsulfatase|nr:sulfatase [Candidatus Falkowbacteria bacterium]MBT4433442.1 sulfatase [Candidatus Falkowbacteria bacterium]
MRKILKILLFSFLITIFIVAGFLIYSENKKIEAEKINPPTGGENSNKKIKVISEEEKANNISQNNNKINKVVLITIDTLRADHLGYMGYPRDTSPFLDKLAREGALLKNAHTVIPSTISSHSSIFTSLYPIQHKTTNHYEVLNDTLTTMAEFLKENGFKTAAFVGGDSMYISNLDQGFDMYNFSETGFRRRRSVQTTVDEAIEWLNEQPSEDKIFLWIHTWDLHYPYIDIPNNIQEEFILEGKDKEKLVNFWTEEHNVNLNLYKKDKEENLVKVMNGYDGELKFVDRELNRLFNYFEEKQINNNSLWIITGDHGEGLGSHDFYEHAEMVYEEELLTPVIFYSPVQEIVEPKIINDVVENIDILPTIADIIGFSLEEQKGTIFGVSLLPLLTGVDKYIDGYNFAWTGNISETPIGSAIEEIYVEKMPWTGKKWSVQNKKFKYIYNMDIEVEDEFYDLEKDSLEKNNLINQNSKEKDKLKNILFKKIEKLKLENQDIKRQPIERFHLDF